MSNAEAKVNPTEYMNSDNMDKEAILRVASGSADQAIDAILHQYDFRISLLILSIMIARIHCMAVNTDLVPEAVDTWRQASDIIEKMIKTEFPMIKEAIKQAGGPCGECDACKARAAAEAKEKVTLQ